MIFVSGELPEGYTSHNTGGEHSLKHSGDMLTAGVLRAQLLGADEPPHDFAERIFDRAAALNKDNLGEFVFAATIEGTGRSAPVAYATSRHIILGDYELDATVDEILVSPEHRRLGLASWMLGKLAFGKQYMGPHLTSMTIDCSSDACEPWFKDVLAASGFTGQDEKGNPRALLPGQVMKYIRPENYDEILGKMPEGWNGVLDVPGEGDEAGFGEVYRGGILSGKVNYELEDGQLGIENVITGQEGVIQPSQYGLDSFERQDLAYFALLNQIDPSSL